MFGMPVPRWRCWMMSVPMRTLAKANMSTDEAEALAKHLVEVPTTGYMRGLANCLLLEDDPVTKALYASLIDGERTKKTQARYKQHWLCRMEQQMVKPQTRRRTSAAQSSGDWWGLAHPSEDTSQLLPGLRSPTDRQLGLLASAGFNVAKESCLQLREEVACDVSMGFGWGQISPWHTSCIVTPASKIFDWLRLRTYAGVEGMMLQGLHYGPGQSKHADFAGGQTC